MNTGTNLQDDEDLSAVVEKVEKDVASMFRQEPDAIWALLALLFFLIASPLVVFWISDHKIGKEWSETVKNAIESLAVVAAAFGICKWLEERRNRSTDVLLALEKEFKKEKVMNGRRMVEDDDYKLLERSEDLDCLLRFYVLLYGILRAKQVPVVSLSICFRYWLSHYFRLDRTGFRNYVDTSYPTLSKWLRDDCRSNLTFFTPRRFFPDTIDEAFIAECAGKQK